MNNIILKRVIIIYLILIPVMWLLTEGVWGGLHGAIGGIRIGKALGNVLQNPQTSDEVTAFLKKHGISETSSKDEVKSWFERLPSKDKAEFRKLIMTSVKVEDIAGFGSTFAVCVIVFGLIGLLSGALTKSWLYVGILPLISFLLNNPILRFSIIHDMPFNQKAMIVLFSQFLACYFFAYIGALISIKVGKNK